MDDLVVCSLHVVDILHPHFGGFGVRSKDGKGDKLVPFNALSYAWGSQEKTARIRCNDLDVPVTHSLHQALVSIRSRKYETEYIGSMR